MRVEFAEEGRVGVIILSSPKDLNVLSNQLEQELLSSLAILSKSTEVKVIVIISDVPKAFCAGADISRFPKLTLEGELIANNFA